VLVRAAPKICWLNLSRSSWICRITVYSLSEVVSAGRSLEVEGWLLKRRIVPSAAR
jgi:hypothetical protein